MSQTSSTEMGDLQKKKKVEARETKAERKRERHSTINCSATQNPGMHRLRLISGHSKKKRCFGMQGTSFIFNTPCCSSHIGRFVQSTWATPTSATGNGRVGVEGGEWWLRPPQVSCCCCCCCSPIHQWSGKARDMEWRRGKEELSSNCDLRRQQAEKKMETICCSFFV